MGGWGIVLLILAAISFGPTIIIMISKRAAGWKKVRWVVYSLLPLLIVPFIIAIAVRLALPIEKKLLLAYMSAQ